MQYRCSTQRSLNLARYLSPHTPLPTTLQMRSRNLARYLSARIPLPTTPQVLDTALRCSTRRVAALTARRDGERAAGVAISAELAGLVKTYQGVEAAASRAQDAAEYRLVRYSMT